MFVVVVHDANESLFSVVEESEVDTTFVADNVAVADEANIFLTSPSSSSSSFAVSKPDSPLD